MTDGDTPALLRAPQHGIELVDSPRAWSRALDALAAGSGPLALDAERASGFRYSPRAYLVQVYRRGTTNYLVDPISVGNLSEFSTAFGDTEWILHAAKQDLPSLRELGVSPHTLFDTELGARLAGLPRVGLQGAVEDLLGVQLAKEHSAADWSTRPLPAEWLNYAALDVEVLPDLRDAIAAVLADANKTRIAKEEFDAVLREEPPAQKAEPWRRLSGLHRVRGQRNLAIARELWEARDDLARDTDTAPGRLLPDRSIVHAAAAAPTSKKALIGLKDFNGRASRKEADRWWGAIERGRTTDDLPALRGARDAIPPPRAWPDRAPEASRRLAIARDLLARQSERLEIPAENVLTPDHLRRVCWNPSDPTRPSAIDGQLEELGARRWQRDIAVPLLVEAFSQAASIDQSEASALA